MSKKLLVRKVAVLGAGVMGAQIAAHLVNAERRHRAVRPAREGRRPERHRRSRRSPTCGKLEPGAARRQGAGRARSTPANYDEHLELLRGLRPRHRGDRRAHGLEAGPLHEDRAASSPPHAILASNTSGLSINKLAEVLPEAAAPPLLRRALLQPAALHAPGRADPGRDDRRRGARRPRDVPDHHARQGRGPRQGHAELHRQPHRRVLDAGDDAPHRSSSAWASTWSTR